MTNLADLQQRAEVPEAGFATKAATAPKLGLTTTEDRGSSAAYSAGLTTRTQVTKTGATPLSMTVTPTFDAWWECELHMGIVDIQTASWNYMYVSLEISPAPNAAGDEYLKYAIQSHHQSLTRYASYQVPAMWALNANTAYTVTAWMNPGAGTWTYYRGEDYLFMYGRVWAR